MKKNSWALFLLILAGIVLGGFIGSLASDARGVWLAWLRPELRDGQSACAESGCACHNVRTVDSYYHGQYHWRGHCHYHLSAAVSRWRTCCVTIEESHEKQEESL